MNICKTCMHDIAEGNVLACRNCGATFCPECGDKTKKICPYCYNNLEYFG